MQNQNRAFNMIYLSLIMLITTSIQSMEIDYKKTFNQNFIENVLTLPSEVLNQIFRFDQIKETKPCIQYMLWNTPIYFDPPSIPPKPLESKIKFFMQLKTVCRYFNTLLSCEKIGYLCQNYDQNTKDNALQELYSQKKTYDTKQGTKFRLPAMILIYAGANDGTTIWNKAENYTHAFLQDSVKNNDIEFVKTLLEHGADPDMQYSKEPLLFSVTTIEMAQLFINYKVNIHAQDRYGERNVLSYIFSKKLSPELIPFYLARKVDPTLVTSITGFCGSNACLLHEINDCRHWYQANANDSLKKLELFLKTIHPTTITNMINTMNNKGQTPLDMAEKNLNEKFMDGSKDENGKFIYFTIPEVTEAIKKCIALLKEHGALTAQEVAKQANSGL